MQMLMKNLVTLLSLCLSVVVFAQTDGTVPTYKKFPTFPPVKLLLPDSASHFTKEDLQKKKPAMLMLFNPGCSHCQHETEEIIKHIDEVKHIQIVMATPMPFDSMIAFREKYHLENYKNIIIGQDDKFMLPSFFMINQLPFLAFYNRKHELIDTFEGSLPIEKVIAKFTNK